MDLIECRRCGDVFANETNILRHLRKPTPCPPTRSTLGRKYIISERLKMAGNVFPCDYCKKVFKHTSSKFRHRRTCEAYKTHLEIAMTQAQRQTELAMQMIAMQRALDRLSQSMAKMSTESAQPPLDNATG